MSQLMRERIARVVRERVFYTDSMSGSAEQHYNHLIDDLLALRPEPSREALIALLKAHLPSHWNCFSKSNTDDSCLMFNAILAWSRGEAALPTPVWCDHLQWVDRGRSSSFKNGYYGTDGSGLHSAHDNWTVCPICAAPRPHPTPEGG